MSRLWLALTGIFILLASCSTPPSVSDSTPAAQPEASPETTWLEGETAGVEIGLWKPAGWNADTHGGLLLSEQVADTNTQPYPTIRGVVVSFFCPNLEIFEHQSDSPHVAMDIMDQAVALPHVRAVSVAISDPVPFDWNGHDAAYYLLTGHGEMRTLVIGIYLPERDKLLAMNISMPEQEAGRVRAMLSGIFSDFQVEGVVLGGEALNQLPQPLVFPTGSNDQK